MPPLPHKQTMAPGKPPQRLTIWKNETTKSKKVTTTISNPERAGPAHIADVHRNGTKTKTRLRSKKGNSATHTVPAGGYLIADRVQGDNLVTFLTELDS